MAKVKRDNERDIKSPTVKQVTEMAQARNDFFASLDPKDFTPLKIYKPKRKLKIK